MKYIYTFGTSIIPVVHMLGYFFLLFVFLFGQNYTYSCDKLNEFSLSIWAFKNTDRVSFYNDSSSSDEFVRLAQWLQDCEPLYLATIRILVWPVLKQIRCSVTHRNKLVNKIEDL